MLDPLLLLTRIDNFVIVDKFSSLDEKKMQFGKAVWQFALWYWISTNTNRTFVCVLYFKMCMSMQKAYFIGHMQTVQTHIRYGRTWRLIYDIQCLLTECSITIWIKWKILHLDGNRQVKLIEVGIQFLIYVLIIRKLSSPAFLSEQQHPCTRTRHIIQALE